MSSRGVGKSLFTLSTPPRLKNSVSLTFLNRSAVNAVMLNTDMVLSVMERLDFITNTGFCVERKRMGLTVPMWPKVGLGVAKTTVQVCPVNVS